MPQVLLVTLGPVQDFIAAARRARDLWFGSWLLSELSKAAARAIAEEHGTAALVFPGVEKLSDLAPASDPTVANKIVARLPDGADPAGTAGKALEAVRKRLADVRDAAFRKIDDRLGNGNLFHRQTAEAQLADLIEVAWVSAPEGAGGYPAARRQAEGLLTSRKHTRLWGPVPWGAPVPKSSIDGARESVLHEDLFDGIEKQRWSAEEVRTRYGVGKAERLCGVGLLKRHGTREGGRFTHRFLSTGHVAAWPVLERLEQLAGEAELAQACERFLGILREAKVPLEQAEVPRDRGDLQALGRYDGSILFEGRLAEMFKEVPEESGRRFLEPARGALREILRKVGVPTPLPYYSVLLADGDRMGRAIDRLQDAEEHWQLSHAVDRFARLAKPIVEEDHNGELLYAGGDDVLAFVPLHRAIDCARALRARFREEIEGSPAGRGGQIPTLSVGIGISHFIEPMGSALALARKAERRAKELRDALAVVVDKRSGPPVAVRGRWGTLDQDLTDFVTLHLEDLVPDGAAYELEELARLPEGAEGTERQALDDLVRKEAERILRRKQPAHGGKAELAGPVLDRLVASLDQRGCGELARRLIVARLLADAAAQAALPAEVPA